MITVNRIFQDGSIDTIEAKTIKAARSRKIPVGKKLTALQIIDAVSGVILAIIRILQATKK